VKGYRLMRAIKIGFFAIVAVGVVSFVVMSLWNALVPAIFSLRPISFWQALGLLLLAKLLFGGFRPSCGNGRHWRRRMAERWDEMSPEEREKFKHGMRFRYAGGGSESRAEKREGIQA
jgi:hypothetical protein